MLDLQLQFHRRGDVQGDFDVKVSMSRLFGGISEFAGFT